MDISRKFLPDGRANLAEFTLPELERWFVEELGEPRFRAEQVWQWIWRKLERDFDSMSNVSKKSREKLKEKAAISLPEIEKTRESSDGSVKMLLRLSDGEKLETVLIPAENRMGNIRWSQCLSTQAGCPMRCSFCATGQMGFKRNLTMGEILGQVAIGRDYLDDRRLDWPVLRNLVFMGMGEPLLNLEALIPALESLASEKGMNFSPRRLTVSTCGIPGALEKLGESGLAYLAVSLHAPDRELRKKLMPGAAKWPLEDMMTALESYPLKTRERVTYEYLLLGGVNDSADHARALAKLLSRTRGKVNLIVYNPVPGLPYKRPSDETVAAFQKILFDKNIMCIVRKSRGSDIEAACGQLATEETVGKKKKQ